ncbi:MAG TPA: class I SAM-dependent methyltransferase [Candidatus Polarisedimenticolia bacterium]|nr:class I SAM-dependent methyltransferase [Candidatus Polarisedimenticolia bacterium]
MNAAASGADLDRLLSPGLRAIFDDRFVRSCGLFEEYIRRLAIRVVRTTGLDEAARVPGTAADIAARAGLDPERSQAPVAWLLSTLAASRVLTRVPPDGVFAGGPDRFVLDGALPGADPAAVAREQEAHDPACLPSYRLADRSAALYPDVLRGRVSGEEALFAPDQIGAWIDYFSNDNPLYAVSNRIGALAVERALPRAGAAAVLEIGGGLGSATAAVYERLAATGRTASVGSYRFTEVAPSFLRRGQRGLAALLPGAPITPGRLDMDRPFAEAGIAPESVTLVYGVNTLHVARDLEFTFGEIRRALAPGGTLVLSECVRPFADRPVDVEFIFNLLESFRSPRRVDPWRPHGGFLSPEQWMAGLRASGFRDVAVEPDIARLRDRVPACVIASISAARG